MPEVEMTDAPIAVPSRFEWLDVAKGLGILLVVYGHVVGGVRDAGLIPAHGWISNSFYFVYTFHMPLFMFLAGILVANRLAKGRGRFFKSLGTGIVLPYLIWAPVAVLVLSATDSLRNGGPIGGLFMAVMAVLWNPPGWLWFFYGLMICHLIAIVNPFGRYGMLLIGLALMPINTMLHVSTLIDTTSYVILFYALGVAIGPALVDRPFRVPLALLPVLLVLFGATYWLVWSSGKGYWSPQAVPAALTGAAFVLALSASLLKDNRLLAYLGRRSMAIYVLHIFFVAGIRIVLDKIFDIDTASIILTLAFVGGIVGPMIVYEIASRCRVSEWVGLGKPLAWKPATQAR